MLAFGDNWSERIWPGKTWVKGIICFWFWSLIVFFSLLFGLSFIRHRLSIDLQLADLAIIVHIIHQLVTWVTAAAILSIIFIQKKILLRDVWGLRIFGIGDIIQGMVAGAVLSLLYLGIVIYIEPLNSTPSALIKSDLFFLLAIDVLLSMTVVVIVEEIVFRGIIFRLLDRNYPFLVSIVLSSAIFTLFHLHHFFTQPLLLFHVFVFGLVSAGLFKRTQSLTASTILHFMTNTSSSITGYLSYF